MSLSGNDLAAWDLSGQNLSDASLSSATLTSADLTNANLSGASFASSSLANANFSGAIISHGLFTDTTASGFTARQLYVTRSYQAKDLTGIDVGRNDLSNWSFRGQNLTAANFQSSKLSGANLADSYLANSNLGSAILIDANLTGADLRGAVGWDGGGLLNNTIRPDGVLQRLVMAGTQQLEVRDDDGVPHPSPAIWLKPRQPIPITVKGEMNTSNGGILKLSFDSDRWDSPMSFEAGIPVQLGGTLEPTFTDDTQLASQSGRTIKAFDWTGVKPQGTFTVHGQPGTAWDTSKLYTAGEVTLLGISSDLNSDKDVDSEDLLDFLTNWTGSDYAAADKTWQTGDSDEDGDVDSADMLVFLSQWTGAAASAPIATVPEPTSASLGGVAVTGLLLTRRRRRA
ncbi:MAG: pentapeptide repeat-containing protein [Pirellulales bacterium]